MRSQLEEETDEFLAFTAPLAGQARTTDVEKCCVKFGCHRSSQHRLAWKTYEKLVICLFLELQDHLILG